MAIATVEVRSLKVSDIFRQIEHLSVVERLTLAKLLLDSVLSSDWTEADWMALGLDAFQKDWDNPEDAIYDNWRELYGIPAR